MATTVADNGINPGMASFFTGIAISMYCPQMMGSIGNGTFLNHLQGLQGIAGHTAACRASEPEGARPPRREQGH